MSSNQLHAEQEALQGLLDLMREAERCRILYERAGMLLPEPLRRLFAISTNGTATAAGQVTVPAPERSSRPPEYQPEWIWIDIKGATPTSVVHALLRRANGTMRAGAVVAAVQEYLPNTPSGSIANIGSRQDGLTLRRKKDGWELLRADDAGIIFDGQLWGPASVFQKAELATHRRDAVLHVMRSISGGLQISQIVDHLRKCLWVKAPVTKDLVQDDIKLLAADRKIRRGSSRKWKVIQEGK